MFLTVGSNSEVYSCNGFGSSIRFINPILPKVLGTNENPGAYNDTPWNSIKECSETLKAKSYFETYTNFLSHAKKKRPMSQKINLISRSKKFEKTRLFQTWTYKNCRNLLNF